MKNFLVAVEIVVQSYEEGAGPSAQNSQHRRMRVYASLPCDESDIDAKIAEVAGKISCDPTKLTQEPKPDESVRSARKN